MKRPGRSLSGQVTSAFRYRGQISPFLEGRIFAKVTSVAYSLLSWQIYLSVGRSLHIKPCFGNKCLVRSGKKKEGDGLVPNDGTGLHHVYVVFLSPP